MTFYTDGPLTEAEQRGIHELPLSTGRYVSESFQHGLEETPTAQSLRALEVLGAKGQPEDADITDPMSGAVIGRLPARPVEKIPVEEAQRRVKEANLERQIDLGKRTEIEAPALDIMMDHARDRAHREAQLARGPSGVLPGVAATGASFFAGALDPLSLAAFSVPVLGEARMASLMAGAGESIMARAAVRGGIGAAQGAVGMTALQPIEALAHSIDGRDFGFADALTNIAAGAGLGGVLHAGGGGIADIYRGYRGTPLYPFGPGELFDRRLWDRIQAGELTEATGGPSSPILHAAKMVRQLGGLQNFDQYKAFKLDYARNVQTQDDLLELVDRHAQTEPSAPAPAPPSAAPTVSRGVTAPLQAGAFPQVEALLAHPEVRNQPANERLNFTLDDVLNTPHVADAIEHPQIEREHDVPFGSAASATIGTHVDRNVPSSATIDGKEFDPAIPANVARHVEREAIERMQQQFRDAKGREPNDREVEKIINFARKNFATPAEKAWVTARGIDWDKYQDAWRGWHDKIDHENPVNPPSGLYATPLPPRLREKVAKGEAAVTEAPKAEAPPPTGGFPELGGTEISDATPVRQIEAIRNRITQEQANRNALLTDPKALADRAREVGETPAAFKKLLTDNFNKNLKTLKELQDHLDRPDVKARGQAEIERAKAIKFKELPAEEPAGPTTAGQAVTEFGKGITEGLHRHLWDRIQAGEVTETTGGPQSALLQAAKMIRSRGGLQTFEQYKAFADDYGRSITAGTPTFQQDMRALVERHAPKAETLADFVERIRQQAIASGLPEDQAAASAQLLASRYTARAARLGVDPMALIRQDGGLAVQAGVEGEAAPGERSFEQFAEKNPIWDDPANVAKLRDMLAAGKNQTEIAEEFGIGRGALQWKMKQEGLHGPGVQPSVIRSTSENVETLKQMLDKGATFDEIGKHFGISRDAISGVVYRLGLNSPEAKAGRQFTRGPTLAPIKLGPIEHDPFTAVYERALEKFIEKGDRSFEQRPTAPTFYSAVSRAIEGAKQEKASPAQWLGMLKNMPGVKPEEMEWLGLSDWLKEQKGSVTKQQIADYVRANQIEVKEVEKGGPKTALEKIEDEIRSLSHWPNDPKTARDPAQQGRLNELLQQWETENGSPQNQPTNFSSYQLPGGENYREMLLTLPPSDTAPKEAAIRAQISAIEERIHDQTGPGRAYDRAVEADPERNRLYQELQALRDSTEGQTFRSSHFDEPNILAHVRFNDRTIDGKKTLFVEEVQSDWHQKGKKSGYRSAPREQYSENDLQFSRTEGDQGKHWFALPDGTDRPGWGDTVEAARADAFRSYRQTAQTMEDYEQTKGVPDAPFKTTWPELAMKRMIRYAAENGYDKVAWTTGETQAERYDLSKTFDHLQYNPKTKEFQAFDKKGILAAREHIEPDKLADYIGKEPTDKLLQTKLNAEGLHKLENADLKIGGEGMKGFYDQILPATVNKLVKKFGGKVGKGTIGEEGTSGIAMRERHDYGWQLYDRDSREVIADHLTEEDARERVRRIEAERAAKPIHSLDISDKLRDAATEQGFPLFQKGGTGEPLGRITFAKQQRIIELFQRANASTLPHEFGHMWLEELISDAARSDAPAALKADRDATLKWLGVDKPEDIATQQHEQFARGFEQYLREGKAPSSALERVFEKFKQWLTAIYQHIRELGTPISDDMRAVFDRLLATDKEIAERRRPPASPFEETIPAPVAEEAIGGGPAVNPATGTDEILPPVESHEVLKGAVASLMEGKPVRAGEHIEGAKAEPPTKGSGRVSDAELAGIAQDRLSALEATLTAPLPNISYRKHTSGTYKGWTEATVKDGPYAGMGGTGRDRNDAKYELIRSLIQRDPSLAAPTEAAAPAPTEAAAPAPPPAAAAEPAAPTSLADHFRDYFLGSPDFLDKHSAYLEEGKRFATIVQARRFAKDMGFGEDTKAIDEAIEHGAVQAARSIAQGEGSDVDKFAELVGLYDRQPRLSTRTSTSMRDQAYSTPVPLAYVASRLSRVEPRKNVYEPSAGNGALLMEVDPPNYAVANEINPSRAKALREQGFRVTERDASDPGQGRDLRHNGGVDVVLANPPFGPIKDPIRSGNRVFDLSDIQQGYSTHEIDHAIALRALEAMKDDGRGVLLIGGINKLAKTAEARSDAYNAKAKREFFKVLFDRYNVTDHFTVAGELYERQGAGWPIDVLVIEGRGKSARALPAVEPPRVYNSWDEVGKVIDEARRTQDAGPAGGAPGGPPVALTEPAGPRLPDAGGGAPVEGGGPAGGLAPQGRPEDLRVGPVPGEPGNVPAGGERPPEGAGRPQLEPGLGDAGRPGGEPAAERPSPGVAGPDFSFVPNDGWQGNLIKARVYANALKIDHRGMELPEIVKAINERLASRPEAGAAPSEVAAASAIKEALDPHGTAGARVIPVEKPSGLADALRQSKRVMKLGGQTDIVMDPHAEQILSRKADLAKVEAALAENGITQLKPLDAGFQSVVLDAGDKVVRLGVSDLGKMPDIPEYNKPIAQEQIGGVRVEILPKLDTANITAADVKEMQDQLAERHLKWGDAAPDNLGRDQNGELKIIDGRISATKEGETPPAANIPPLTAPKPVKPRIIKSETETGSQVAYTPQSTRSEGLGTLVPVNMKKSIADSLEGVAKRRGDIDNFVAGELGYSVEEMSSRFAAEQVDALALALDNIKQNKGFIIGDQTGIGKGRVNAGIIRWAIRNNRIPVFVTEKPNLYGDMYRDLTDIGLADMLDREPRFLMTNAGQDVPLSEDGKLRLKTPPPAAHNAMLLGLPHDAVDFLKEYDAVFTNYSQMQTVAEQDTPRRAFLRAIAPDSVVIFDESHNAGGQNNERAPKGPPDRAGFARELVAQAKGVFYSSATYAKRPDVMDLYSKTDMAMAVADPKDLGEAIAKGGVPMQQAVASMLARAGQYVRRERSFHGVEYNTPSVAVERSTYDGISRSLNAINEFSKIVERAAARIDQELKAQAGGLGRDASVGDVGAQSTNFTSIMHNVVGQVLLALKAKPAARMAIEALERGEKPVITVAGTMEAFLKDFAENMDIKPGDPVTADFGDVIKKYLDRTRTLIIKKPFAKKGESERKYLSDAELGLVGVSAYRRTKQMIDELDLKDLPISPIDAIKSELTKAGYRVGEITGRGTIIDYSGKRPILKPRPGAEVTIKGRAETIRRFNGGTADKPLPKEQVYDAMVLNQAGATGLSLHASAKFGEQAQRHMFIAQPEANIDTHMQLLGRIHRTGQVVLPKYSQLIADIPAEKRPAAVLAKKMASLNANTTAARGSAMTAKDVPDFMNAYGDMVAAALIQESPEMNARLGSPVKFSDTGRIEAEDAMRKLTGRIPLLPLKEQEALYGYLETEYNSLLEQMKAAGENALEAQTLDLRAQTVERREVVARKTASDSPFAAPVQIEHVMAKRLGKPFKSDELVSKVLEGLGETGEVTPENAGRLLENIGKRAAARQEEQAKDAIARFESYKRGVIDELDTPERQEQERAKQDAYKDRWTEMQEMLPPGQRVVLKTANGNLTGVVLKVEQKGKPKNPLALSTWKADIAIADATKRIELPFSRLYQEGTSDPEDALAIEVGHITDWLETKQKTLDRFDSQQSDAREARYIATGNLLAAYDWLNRKGRVVNYTDAEGHTRQGILTPRDFDFAGHAGTKKTAIGDARAVMEHLRKNPDEELTSADGNVKIYFNQRAGRATIEVAGAKRLGGVYYLDRALTDIVGDFSKAGGKMTARTTEAKLEPAIGQLQKLGATFAAVRELPPAEEVGAARPASTMTREQAWDALSSEPLPHEERGAVETSRAAETAEEPASAAQEPKARQTAAAKAEQDTAAQVAQASEYISEEERAAMERALQEHDQEQVSRAQVVREGIACLTIGGLGKEEA